MSASNDAAREQTASVMDKTFSDAIEQLAKRLNSAQAPVPATPSQTGHTPRHINWYYLVILLIVIAATAAVIYFGRAPQPQVNVEYNVGEIIGGLLAGAGVAAAGVAYAAKTLSRE